MGLTGTPVLVLRMGRPCLTWLTESGIKCRRSEGLPHPAASFRDLGRGLKGQTPCSAHTHPDSLAQCVVQEENVTESLLSGA